MSFLLGLVRHRAGQHYHERPTENRQRNRDKFPSQTQGMAAAGRAVIEPRRSDTTSTPIAHAWPSVDLLVAHTSPPSVPSSARRPAPLSPATTVASSS